MRGVIVNTSLSRVNCDKSLSFNTNDGKWHFYAMTYNGSAINDYADGVFVGSCFQSGNIQSTAIPLNINAYDSNLEPAATIDDARIYNRALSAAEIQALYNAEK